MMLNDVNKDVYTWIGNYFNTTSQEISQVLADERATSFLMIWPIFEQRCFSGFMKKEQIEQFVSQFGSKIKVSDFDQKIQHFHKRYQDKTKYKNLKHSDSFYIADDIIHKKYEDITDSEKMIVLLYVIYRFRNNIFHGNKGIQSWSRYSEEINCCLTSMTAIIDAIK